MIPMGEELDNTTAAAGRRDQTRCVVLVGRLNRTPDVLLDGLEKRGASVRVVNDPPSAMVEMARGARVIVVSEPHTVRRLPELMAAIRRYYPRAKCWCFDPNAVGAPALRPIDRAAVKTKSAVESILPPTAPAPTATMPPAAPRRTTPTATTRGNGSGLLLIKPPEEEPLITPDELAMLLEPLPDSPMPRIFNDRDAEAQR